MAEKHVLVIAFPLEDALLDRIRSMGFKEVHYHPCIYIGKPSAIDHPGSLWNYDPPPVPKDVWARATVLLTMFSTPTPEEAPLLRYIQGMSAGMEHMMSGLLALHAAVKSKGTSQQAATDGAEKPMHGSKDDRLVVASASGVHSTCIAEHVLMSILNHFHRFHVLQSIQASRSWDRTAYVAPGTLNGTRELRDHTVGIIGYGCIGREVARLAHAFGMRVVAMTSQGVRSESVGYTVPGTGDPSGCIPAAWYASTPRPSQVDGTAPSSSSSSSSYGAFFECVDVVVVCCPATPSTTHIIDTDSLALMHRAPLIINVGRGALIHQPALIHALESKRIAGAVLDVTTPEPLPPNHPLWTTVNCTITPHISGSTEMYSARCIDLFEMNVARYVDNNSSTVVNQVNLEKGY